MAAGFQTFNTNGTYQVDGVYKHFVMTRRVDIATTETTGGTSVNGSQVGLAKAENEIIALRCNSPCAHIGTLDGQIYVRTTGPIGTVISCYFFAPITTSDATVGLQVFSESGELVFCASKKPLSFRDFVVGEGIFSYESSRTFAALMITQRYEVSDIVIPAGTQGGRLFRLIAARRGMASNASGGISVSYEVDFQDMSDIAGSPGPPSQACTSPFGSLHALIDVTNY
ncbi:hypothetical protein ACQ4WP_28225 [Janthinobacterium sp. GB4P2]|uniref:hypothetical protein n=1 Tax=Janthinobacterium sp. GB4P2 TaxID=3424189 RepID=UPI003F276E4C